MNALMCECVKGQRKNPDSSKSRKNTTIVIVSARARVWIASPKIYSA